LRTVHRFIPEGEQKPNPRILLEIIGDNGIQGSPDEAAYVGDNLMKDIVMAQEAGVADVYAAFGAVAQDAEIYEQLRRVSHWSREDVERDRAIYLSGAVVPNYRLAHSWWEIFDLFDFVPHNKHPIGM
jgi:FMN phosphatase YigB (HAD superfamily)